MGLVEADGRGGHARPIRQLADGQQISGLHRWTITEPHSNFKNRRGSEVLLSTLIAGERPQDEIISDMALLLCDLDDTLVSRAAVFDCWVTDFASGRKLDQDEIDWLVAFDQQGRLDRTLFFAGLIERYGLALSVPELIERWRLEFASRYRLSPAVRAALHDARRAGWKIAVVTNGRERVQLAKLDACQIYPVLDGVCVSEEIGAAKPDLRIFAAAANRARCPLQGGWMIGDNAEADVGGGRAAGLRTAWLSLGRPGVGPGAPPDLTVDSFPEAVAGILEVSGL